MKFLNSFIEQKIVKKIQLNRESDRLSSVIPDQRKQFEETFNIVKQGLDDLKTTSDEYWPVRITGQEYRL